MFLFYISSNMVTFQTMAGKKNGQQESKRSTMPFIVITHVHNQIKCGAQVQNGRSHRRAT